jgi:hypothetical protein
MDTKALAHEMFPTIMQKVSPHVPSVELTEWCEAYIKTKLDFLIRETKREEGVPVEEEGEEYSEEDKIVGYYLPLTQETGRKLGVPTEMEDLLREITNAEEEYGIPFGEFDTIISNGLDFQEVRVLLNRLKPFMKFDLFYHPYIHELVLVLLTRKNRVKINNPSWNKTWKDLGLDLQELPDFDD